MDNILLTISLIELLFCVAACTYICVHTWRAARELREMKRKGNGND